MLSRRNLPRRGSHTASLPHPVALQLLQAFPEANGSLPAPLYRLLDPTHPVELPAAVKLTAADNRELDKLVAALGRNKATWRRAILLHEWLLQVGHKPDDRLCTSLIRVCAQHGQAVTALAMYDWMRAAPSEGGGGLECTVYTYTAAMRAALSGNMLDRALSVWADAEANHAHEIDCRLCTTLIEVCMRRGDTARALDMYQRMRSAPATSKLAPTVHAYTAAMRAAAEGGRWQAALQIWDDMAAVGCKPTGHAYSAVISACAAGGDWQRAVALFDEMLAWGVKPDVVSCTALVTALGADGQWERAERVVEWMLRNDIRPNVRTYTALVSALATARQWERAGEVLRRMKAHALGPGVEPNAYTYSALLKGLGDAGKWAMAESIFAELEQEQLAAMQAEAAMEAAAQLAMDSAAAAVAAGQATSALPGYDGTESAEERRAADRLVERTAALALGSLDAAEAEEAIGDDSAGYRALAAPGFSYFSVMNGSGGMESPTSALSAATLASPLATATSNKAAAAPPAAAWTADNAALQGLRLDLDAAVPANGAAHRAVLAAAAPAALRLKPLPKGRGPINEVVCGALMLAYERAGRWGPAVAVLDRARALGVPPNTVMYNTAVSALGKAGQVEAAERLFAEISQPDGVSYETLIAAYGMAGKAEAAEAAVERMASAGFAPQDYAYCGLIAAHSLHGDWRAALKVKERAASAGVATTVHMYNALIAACERAHQYEKAVVLGREMQSAGVRANSVTQQLLDGVCKEGVRAVETQQAAVAALTAAVAAAGTVMIRAGIF